MNAKDKEALLDHLSAIAEGLREIARELHELNAAPVVAPKGDET